VTNDHPDISHRLAWLTHPQLEVIRTALLRIYAVANKVMERGPGTGRGGHDFSVCPPKTLTADAGGPWGEPLIPFNFFLIDGDRGSGKTTVLHLLAELAARLGSGDERCPPWQSIPGLKAPQVEGLGRRHRKDKYDYQTALVLPPLYPDLQEGEETGLIEQVLAHIDHVLRARVFDLTQQAEDEPDWICPELAPDGQAPGQDPCANRARALRVNLHQEVAAAWVFAQRFGQDVLGKDSVDFREYVRQRSRENSRSAMRRQRWRDFVHGLLDELQCVLLVIPIDDCDLSPTLGQEVLRALRLYFTHPRILVLFAANMEGLEHNLVTAYYQDVASIAPVYGSPMLVDEGLEPEQRPQLVRDLHQRLRFQAQEAAAHLAKLLPPAMRLRIGPCIDQDVLSLLLRTDSPRPESAAAEALKTLRAVLKNDKNHSLEARVSLLLWRIRYRQLFASLTARDLITIRSGEPVRNDLENRIEPSGGELIQIKAGPDGAACAYHERADASCRIYPDRPLECRALECWDTRRIEAIYGRDRLTRADLLSGMEGLWDLVCDHDRRCTVDLLWKAAADRDRDPGGKAAERIETLLRYDEEVRRLVVSRGKLDPGMLDFLFGRPLRRVLAAIEACRWSGGRMP